MGQWVGRVCTADPSVDQHAAVDIDGSTGDVGRQVGGQEQAGPSDVFGVAEAVERNALEDLDLKVVGELVTGDVGLDQPRRHRIAPDAVGAEFPGHGLGETQYA